MTRKYYLNNKEITKEEWTTAFYEYTNARVVLKVDHLLKPYSAPETKDIVTPERARALRNQFRPITKNNEKPSSSTRTSHT